MDIETTSAPKTKELHSAGWIHWADARSVAYETNTRKEMVGMSSAKTA